jgi:hypothetical protein
MPKTVLDSQCLCFDEFPERRFELVAKLQTEKLSGDLPSTCSWLVFNFVTNFFLKCDLLVGGQDRAYSFRNARNREDAAQRLQRFVHWEVSSEETSHRRFAVLASP